MCLQPISRTMVVVVAVLVAVAVAVWHSVTSSLW